MAKPIASATPGGGSGIEFKDFLGKLFVVEPLEVETGITTSVNKPGETSDAVRANVYVLTGPDSHEEFIDTLIFPRRLFNQLKKSIDTWVVGRLAQGEKQPGKNAPWMLNEATAKDMEKATKFIMSLSASAAKSSSKGEPENEDEDEGYEDDDDDAY